MRPSHGTRLARSTNQRSKLLFGPQFMEENDMAETLETYGDRQKVRHLIKSIRVALLVTTG